jgi:hypothetical protein
MLQTVQELIFSEPVVINIADIENIYGRSLPMSVKLSSLWISTISRTYGAVLRDRTGRSIQLKYYESLPYLKPGSRVNVTATLYPHDSSRIFLNSPEDIELLSPSYITKLKPCHLSAQKQGPIDIGFELMDLPISIQPDNIRLLIDGTASEAAVEENRVICTSSSILSNGSHRIKAEVKHGGFPTLIKEWSFTVYDPQQEANIYMGIPHTHTSYSDGMGTPSLACIQAIKSKLDYMFITDHSHRFDGVTQLCYEYSNKLGEYVEVQGSEWFKTRRQVEEINSLHSSFTALRGFEMSCSLGHINVLNTPSYVEGKLRIKKTEDFLKWLLLQEDAIATINHPESINMLFSGSLMSVQKELDGLLCLIEVGNGTPGRGYVRYENVFFEGLDRGWHWGVLNSQDNHTDDWGHSTNLTGILAFELSPQGLLSALRNRNTYSTETGTLRLSFSLEGLPMGSLIGIDEGSRAVFDVSAQDESYPIRKLELISNGGNVIDEKYFSDVALAKWNPQIRVQDSEKWYVLKVIHSNDAWGISSPIFIKPKQ